jgi:hypothetical protein
MAKGQDKCCVMNQPLPETRMIISNLTITTTTTAAAATTTTK